MKHNTIPIQIIGFTDVNAHFIKELNYEWLNMYFHIEPRDRITLSNPRREIIDKDGHIYYATYNGNVVGTATLIKIHKSVFELGKMAVTQSAQGLGIGTLLLEHSIKMAKELNAKKLILYSNTRLASAMHMYNKYGFKTIELEPGLYQRANIKMELNLQPE